jgi:DNA-binding GntR family transcriptional regulator
MVLAPAVARRRDQWLKELADGLDQLEAKVEGFKVENLQHDEEFVSAVIEASRWPSAHISRKSARQYGMRCLTSPSTVPPMRINSRRFYGTSMS